MRRLAAYWPATVPSGVVMTEQRRRPELLNLLLGPTISLHRATTWLTASDPRIAELLHHSTRLGTKQQKSSGAPPSGLR
jgi:hypothetical protein